MILRSRHACKVVSLFCSSRNADHCSAVSQGVVSLPDVWHGVLSLLEPNISSAGRPAISATLSANVPTCRDFTWPPAHWKAQQQVRGFASGKGLDPARVHKQPVLKPRQKDIKGRKFWATLYNIRDSQRWEDVQQHLWGSGFNRVHSFAAITQFAKIYTELPLDEKLQVRAEGKLEVLQQLAGKYLQTYTAWELARALHAFADVDHAPPPEMMRGFTEAVTGKLADFTPRAIAITLWAMAKLQYFPGTEFLQRVTKGMTPKLGSFNSWEASMALWAFATWQHPPGAGVLNGMAASIGRSLPQLISLSVAQSLWAFAKLGHRPKPKLLDGLISAAKEAMPTMQLPLVAMVVWSVGKLKPRPIPYPLLQAAGDRLEDGTRDEDLSTFMVGLAHLGCEPADRTMQAVAHQATERMPQLNPQHMANLTWAFAKLGVDPGGRYWHALCEELPIKAPAFLPQTISLLMWSSATLQRALHPVALDAVLRAAYALHPAFGEQAMVNTMWAMVRTKCHPPPVLLYALAGQADALAGGYSPRGLAVLMWSLCRLGCPPSNGLLAAAHGMLERGETVRGDRTTDVPPESFKGIAQEYAESNGGTVAAKPPASE